MEFDAAFEDAILASCLRSKDYLRRAARLAKEHHFTGKERAWVWKEIHGTWTRYRELTTARLLLAEAKRQFNDVEHRKPYLEFAERIAKKRPKAPRASLEKLAEFVSFVDAQISLEAAAEALENGDLEAVRKELAKGSKKATSDVRYTHIQWIDEFDARQAKREHESKHPDEFKTIPTGFKRFDKAMSGGARAGELGLIMGTTGRGKSVALTNIGQAGVNRGFNVAYFAMEMPAHQVATRQDSRWSGEEYYKFKKWDFTAAELKQIHRRHKLDMKRFANKYHILSFPVRSATIHDVRNALEDLFDEHEFTADMLLIDSGDHLVSEFSKESFRIQQADVYWKMKELAEEDGYVVWSSVHAGREWAKRIATAEATAEAYDKARIADTVLSLNELSGDVGRDGDDDDDDEDEEEADGFVKPISGVRLLEAYLAKYRDGESKFKFQIAADFARMTMKQADDVEEE